MKIIPDLRHLKIDGMTGPRKRLGDVGVAHDDATIGYAKRDGVTFRREPAGIWGPVVLVPFRPGALESDLFDEESRGGLSLRHRIPINLLPPSEGISHVGPRWPSRGTTPIPPDPATTDGLKAGKENRRSDCSDKQKSANHGVHFRKQQEVVSQSGAAPERCRNPCPAVGWWDDE